LLGYSEELQEAILYLRLFVSLFPTAFLPRKVLWRSNGVIVTCGVLTNLGILGSGEISLCGIGRSVPENGIRADWGG
jgi:hypothetical protein